MAQKPLSELDPTFTTFNGARGLIFDCPICEGTQAHSIAVTFDPPSLFPSGAIWTLVDANPSTYTVSPSINCNPHCPFHGFVQNGMVRW